jgi:hypothetical protein
VIFELLNAYKRQPKEMQMHLNIGYKEARKPEQKKKLPSLHSTSLPF